MVRMSKTVFTLATLAIATTAFGFTPARVSTFVRVSSRLSMSEPEASEDGDGGAAPEPTPLPPPPMVKNSKGKIRPMRMRDVRQIIDKLDADNFSESLKKIEPYLLTVAGQTFYKKAMKAIKKKAKIHLEPKQMLLPEKYAYEARATVKRRASLAALIEKKKEKKAAIEAGEEPPEESEEPKKYPKPGPRQGFKPKSKLAVSRKLRRQLLVDLERAIELMESKGEPGPLPLYGADSSFKTTQRPDIIPTYSDSDVNFSELFGGKVVDVDVDVKEDKDDDDADEGGADG